MSPQPWREIDAHGRARRVLWPIRIWWFEAVHRLYDGVVRRTINIGNYVQIHILYASSRPSKHAVCDIHNDDKRSRLRHHDGAASQLCWVLLDVGDSSSSSSRSSCVRSMTERKRHLGTLPRPCRQMGPNERSATKLNELPATSYELRRAPRAVCGINDLCCRYWPPGLHGPAVYFLVSKPTASIAYTLHTRLSLSVSINLPRR